MKHIARAALAGALVLVGSAYASDGTVTITGKIVGNTCTITNASPTVTLPTVALSNLTASGNTSGATQFSIDVKCTNGAAAPANLTGVVKAYFELGANVDGETGRLKIASGTGNADKLQLQLLNDDGGVIKIGDPSSISGPSFDTDGKATLKYKVRYYATGAVTSGAVSSSVTYSLMYQ